jgi:asparagine synthase (glutamine-hydrolysing)
MSGVVGVWNLDGRPLDPGILSGMSGTLRHRGPDGEGRRVSGACGLACHHQWVTREEIGEIQPLVDNGVLLVMDGRLDDRDALLDELGLARTASDASCALAAYGRWEERFGERLNGDFAIALFDQSKQRLLLVRDSIGIRPLYYFHSERRFAFASEIKALLAHPDVPARPDNEGLADFMLLGSRPVDRQEVTCFAGISALVPAHLAVITPERMSVRRYWDFDTGRTLRFASLGDYAEAFGERFAEAIRRRVRSAYPVSVSLSGGLDSSSIFCQAESLRRAGRVRCPAVLPVSYTAAEGTDADEGRYLLEIEREYGVQIERFPIEPLTGLVQGAAEQVRAIEAPFVDYMWGVTRELHARASARGSRVLLSGHWGDQVLFSSAYLVDLFRRLAWREVHRHLREYVRWFGAAETRILTRRFAVDLVRHHLPTPLVPPFKWLRRRLSDAERPKPWFSDAFLQRALRFANRPATIGDGFRSAQARSIYLEARSKYHVHCMEWNNKVGALHGLDAAFPFLDRDLLAFLMAIPGEIANCNGVPRALLREAMCGVLPEPVRGRTWKADFSGVVNAGVDQDVPAIARALSAESLGVRLGYLDRARLAPAVNHMSSSGAGPACVSSWELADLFALEVWLKLFLRGSNEPQATGASTHAAGRPSADEKAAVHHAGPHDAWRPSNSRAGEGKHQ